MTLEPERKKTKIEYDPILLDVKMEPPGYSSSPDEDYIDAYNQREGNNENGNIRQENYFSSDNSTAFDTTVKFEPVFSCKEEEEEEEEDTTSHKKQYVRIKKIDDDSESEEENIKINVKVEDEEELKRESIYFTVDDLTSSTYKSSVSASETAGSESGSVKGNIEFESDDDDDGTDKSYTSSENEALVDDSKILCLVCKNLEDAEIKNRSLLGSTDQWCKCGHCRLVGVMNDYDRICCREFKDIVEFLNDEIDDASENQMCVTLHPRFTIEVYNFRALESTRYCNTYNKKITPYSWMSSSFMRWVWNTIESGTRMVIPACVTAKIKEHCNIAFVEPYRANTICETGKHCAESQKS